MPKKHGNNQDDKAILIYRNQGEILHRIESPGSDNFDNEGDDIQELDFDKVVDVSDTLVQDDSHKIAKTDSQKKDELNRLTAFNMENFNTSYHSIPLMNNKMTITARGSHESSMTAARSASREKTMPSALNSTL